MKISPINNLNTTKFASKPVKTENKKEQKYSADEILIRKTKKAASECGMLLVGCAILWFGMKHNFKINRNKAIISQLAEKAKAVKPSAESLENLKL